MLLVLLLGMPVLLTGCGKGTNSGSGPSFDLAEHFPEPRLYEYARKMLGTTVPDVALTDLAGERVSLASFRGKPVIVELARTTCRYCVLVQPVVDEMARKWPEVVFLQLFPDDTEEDIFAYLAATGMPSPASVILTGEQPNDIRASLSNYPFVPLFLFVDGDGTIVYLQGGAMDADTMETAITFAFPELATGRN